MKTPSLPLPVLAVLGALLALGGCTEGNVQSLENGMWYMFAGHPKPKILKKPAAPVYCYPTLGRPVCYSEPRHPKDHGLGN